MAEAWRAWRRSSRSPRPAGTVDLFSIVPVKRSHSVCAQGGINAAKNLKGEGDTTDKHFDDTIYGGDFLANQTPVKAMCEAAPAIIDLLDRMGVPFNRTPEGLLDFRRFGGTLYNRTAFAGATTGQQLLYALDEQVRRYEAEGKVKKYEGWEFLSAVLDSKGQARGITALDLRTMELKSFAADAIILATGGIGAIFGKSTNSVVCTGSAQSAIFQQGAYYANGEFIQVHPTSIPGEDKLRLMSESARGEGGRVWVPRTPGDKRPFKQIPESERFYFLEEWYPKYGNLVPRDVATRAIHKVVYEEGLGIDGQPMVYLDLTHIDRETLNRKLEGILEIYEKFVGDDPREVPMKIFPGMHYTMGGLWVDFNQMTNIPGIFAAGECEYQYHGANRLGANSLVSCIFGGFLAGPECAGVCEESACRGRRWRPRRRAGAPGRDQRQADEERGHGESLQAVARAGPDHDRARDGDPLQQGPEAGRREDRGTAGSLQEGEPERPQPVGQHQLCVCAAVEEHAGAFAHRGAGRAAARRVARRALQAGLPGPQRREVPEDHQGQLHGRRCRPAL